MLTLLFDGIAYGMLLFVLAVGLAVTLGLMNFINLAHGAFAMAGGYITVLLMNRARRAVPGLPADRLRRHRAARRAARAHALPADVRAAAPRPGAVLDRPRLHGGHRGRLRRRLDAAEHPPARRGCRGACRSRRSASASTGSSSSSSAPLLTVALQWVLSRTRFGSRLRASVDDPRVAGGLGLDVNRIFLLTFAVGSGLAGLGGALGAEVLGLDPTFPLKFMIYFLIVVSVGGTTTITGPLLAALAARHRRRRRQVLRAQARRLHRLHADDRDPDAAPAGPVRAGGRRDERARRRRDARAGGALARAATRAGAGGSSRCSPRCRCRGCCCRGRRCCSTRSRSSPCSRSRST